VLLQLLRSDIRWSNPRCHHHRAAHATEKMLQELFYRGSSGRLGSRRLCPLHVILRNGRVRIIRAESLLLRLLLLLGCLLLLL
jgi:hypothetical protein